MWVRICCFKVEDEACLVPDVNFHDEWTYSEADIDYTTYFLRQPGVLV